MDIQEIFEKLKVDCVKESSELTDMLLQEYAKNIYMVYTNNQHHIRSQIASYLGQESSPEVPSECASVVLKVLDYAKTHEDVSHCSHAVGYFYDYLLLESLHLLNRAKIQTEIDNKLSEVSEDLSKKSGALYEQINLRVSEIHKNFSDLQKNIENQLKEDINNQQENLRTQLTQHTKTLETNTKNNIRDSMRDLDVHSITVLGIFTAITFAFSGCFTLVGSALSEIAAITSESAYLLIAVLSLLCVSLFNSICVIIWGLSKFLNKDIASQFSKNVVKWLNIFFIITFLSTFVIYVSHGTSVNHINDNGVDLGTGRPITQSTTVPPVANTALPITTPTPDQ